MLRFSWCALSFLTLLPAAPAAAAQGALCNDGFSDGDNAVFQGGFAVGERAAVKVSAPADGYPFSIEKIQLLFGDDGTTAGEGQNVTLKIYDDTGESAFAEPGFPGAELLSQPASIVSAPDSVNEILLDAPHVVTAGNVWIAIEVGHGGPPGVAADADGNNDTDRNAIFAPQTAGGWVSSGSLGVGGDWIIRAIVETPSTATDPACAFEGNVIPGEGEGEPGEGEGEGDGGEGEGDGVPGGLFVSTINPSSAAEGAEVLVTITGGGFVAGTTTFRIANVTCGGVTVVAEGAATCTVPGELPVGSHDVIAQNGGEQFVFASGFTVTAGGCACASTSAHATLASLAFGLALLATRVRRRRQR